MLGNKSEREGMTSTLGQSQVVSGLYSTIATMLSDRATEGTYPKWFPRTPTMRKKEERQPHTIYHAHFRKKSSRGRVSADQSDGPRGKRGRKRSGSSMGGRGAHSGFRARETPPWVTKANEKKKKNCLPSKFKWRSDYSAEVGKVNVRTPTLLADRKKEVDYHHRLGLERHEEKGRRQSGDSKAVPGRIASPHLSRWGKKKGGGDFGASRQRKA